MEVNAKVKIISMCIYTKKRTRIICSHNRASAAYRLRQRASVADEKTTGPQAVRVADDSARARVHPRNKGASRPFVFLFFCGRFAEPYGTHNKLWPARRSVLLHATPPCSRPAKKKKTCERESSAALSLKSRLLRNPVADVT